MLTKEAGIPEGRKTKETQKENGEAKKRGKFNFNTRGKIKSKKSKELQRTHKNIFDSVQKEKRLVAEKDTLRKRKRLK